MKILGYKLKSVPIQKVELPKGAKVLAALDSNGEPTLFAAIDTDELVTENRTIYRVETGKQFNGAILSCPYIGSFSIANYGIVYHFFAGAALSELQEWAGTGGHCEIEVTKHGPAEYPFSMR